MYETILLNFLSQRSFLGGELVKLLLFRVPPTPPRLVLVNHITHKVLVSPIRTKRIFLLGLHWYSRSVFQPLVTLLLVVCKLVLASAASPACHGDTKQDSLVPSQASRRVAQGYIRSPNPASCLRVRSLRGPRSSCVSRYSRDVLPESSLRFTSAHLCSEAVHCSTSLPPVHILLPPQDKSVHRSRGRVRRNQFVRRKGGVN